MQVAISCRHGSIRDATQEHIKQKCEKLLNYFERVTSIGVIVEFAKDRTSVEITVDAEHKHNFVAKDVGDDVTATFDRTLHKMEQQIKRYKEKIQDHRRDRPLNELTSEETAEGEIEEEETE